jgi:hypothetical protein
MNTRSFQDPINQMSHNIIYILKKIIAETDDEAIIVPTVYFKKLFSAGGFGY